MTHETKEHVAFLAASLIEVSDMESLSCQKSLSWWALMPSGS